MVSTAWLTTRNRDYLQNSRLPKSAKLMFAQLVILGSQLHGSTTNPQGVQKKKFSKAQNFSSLLTVFAQLVILGSRLHGSTTNPQGVQKKKFSIAKVQNFSSHSTLIASHAPPS